MAEKRGDRKPRVLAAPYPWDNWFSQDEFVLTQGKDFKCQMHSMIWMLRQNATKRGMRVSVSVEGDVIRGKALSRLAPK